MSQKKRRRRSGRYMSKADIKWHRAHIEYLKIARPDLNWDAITAEGERLFGPIVPAPSRLEGLRTAVYLISANENGPTKVGVAIDVNKRLVQLQSGHPWPLQVRALVWFRNQKAALTVERWLLDSVPENARLNGEWVNRTPAELERLLQDYVARRFDHDLVPLQMGPDDE